MPWNNDYLVESNDLMKLNDDQKYARKNDHLSWNNDYGPKILNDLFKIFEIDVNGRWWKRSASVKF
jgi:hypothetical protein